MPEQKKLAFIFDLEGVLIDHTKRQCEVATKALNTVGIKFEINPKMYQLRSEDAFHITGDFLSGLLVMKKHNISLEQAMKNPERIARLRGLSFKEAMEHSERISKSKGLTRAEWDKIKQTEANFTSLRTHSKLKVAGRTFVIRNKEPRLKNILEMLKAAKANEIPCVMVTAGKRVDANAFMGEAGLMGVFWKKDYRMYGEDRMKKGSLFAEASKMIAEVYGVRAGRQFVVEDSLSGIKAAKANGLRSVMVLTGNTSLERIKKLKPEERPSIVLNHAKDLVGTLIQAVKQRKAIRFRPEPKVPKKAKARRI